MKLRRLYVVPWFVLTRGLFGPMSGRESQRRLRIMLRQTWLITLGVLLLFGSIIGAALYFESQPTTLRIAVGPANGDDAHLIQAIAQQLSKDRAPIRLRPILKDNTIDSALALDADQADLAVIRRDRAYPKQGLAIAVLRENVVVMIVPASGSLAAGGNSAAKRSKASKPKKIEKVEQIAGRTVGVIGRGGANTDLLNLVLKQYDIPADKVKVVSLDPDDVKTALRNNPVDVIFGAGPVTSHFFADAIAAASKGDENPAILEIGAAAAIAKRLPVYEAAEIKKGVFGGHSPLPEDNVDTISFSHYIVARKTVSDSVASGLTKLLFSVRQSLASEYPAIAQMSKPDTDKDASVLAHPGAAAFIDDEEKTFFDKYSDFIYLGIMVFSGFGSGAAWLASYSRADDRIRKLKGLDMLLDVAAGARVAETHEQLDKLRRNIDELVRRTMHQVERNDLDGSAMVAFSIALNQAQGAVSEQRALLTMRGVVPKPPDEEPAGDTDDKDDKGGKDVVPLHIAAAE
jgi:TRAP transporter TAXI family solute receptor